MLLYGGFTEQLCRKKLVFGGECREKYLVAIWGLNRTHNLIIKKKETNKQTKTSCMQKDSEVGDNKNDEIEFTLGAFVV